MCAENRISDTHASGETSATQSSASRPAKQAAAQTGIPRPTPGASPESGQAETVKQRLRPPRGTTTSGAELPVRHGVHGSRTSAGIAVATMTSANQTHERQPAERHEARAQE